MSDILEPVGNFVNSVGFPIAAAIALFWLLRTTMPDLTNHVSTMCGLQVALLRAALRSRKENGGAHPDEEALLTKLERHNVDIDLGG